MEDYGKRKKVIGLTGGAGCGKTVVMRLIEERFHAGLIIADEIGHKLMAPGGANYKEIVAHFGEGVLDEEGNINRPVLSKIVFSDENQLKKLNSFSHPNIEKEIRSEIERLQGEDVAFIALEAALIIECGYKQYLDELWYIYADEDTRIHRLMEGRGYSEEKSRSVFQNQLKEEEYVKNSDRIIDNSGTVEETYEKLCQAVNAIMGEA